MCDRSGCDEPGTHNPVVLIMPDQAGYEGPPAEMTMGLLVCPAHQAAMTVADLVTDEGWQVIVTAFSRAGKARPRRDTLGLVWRRPGPMLDT